jgi:DNA-binding NarL/FixJ family response regulator
LWYLSAYVKEYLDQHCMIGRRLKNRYLIQQRIGEGSTATVYRALDERLGRNVAVKLLLPNVRDTTRKRFMQEANAAAQLNHPNIMAMYDVDEDEDSPFLVLEYVEGDALSRFIPADVKTVVRLGKQIALALHYAHSLGIIHRDIKPANIKVTPGGQVKIMDMGLALSKTTPRVTAHGMVIGTPAYLSPEQAQGQPLDARTDIYSLGIVLYEMAAGRLPFNSDDIGLLLLQQVRNPAPAITDSNSSFPPGLEAVILKALEKQPTRRFQSAQQLAEALDASLLGQPHKTTEPERAETSHATHETSQSRALRIMLADDHALLRQSLASMLETNPDYVVVAQAGDGESALTKALAVQPDVLLLDLNMPGKGGLDILPTLRREAPDIKVIVLTGRDEDAYIIRALRSGAHGYLLKSSEESELMEGVRKVMAGDMVLGRGVAERVVTGLLTGSGNKPQLDELESRVIQRVAAGFTNDEIARDMDMLVTDIIETLAKSLDKLGSRDRHAAALRALTLGLIVIEDVHQLQPPN